jgi:HK97 gp10 family phage protein
MSKPGDGFDGISDAVARRGSQIMYAAGNLIQVEAQLSITNGAVSGQGHIPSRPGQPPNNDTGRLADQIETVQLSPLHTEVSSNARHAVALEFGTTRMAERPYMRPAVAKTRKEVLDLIRRAADEALKGKGK